MINVRSSGGWGERGVFLLETDDCVFGEKEVVLIPWWAVCFDNGLFVLFLLSHMTLGERGTIRYLVEDIQGEVISEVRMVLKPMGNVCPPVNPLIDAEYEVYLKEAGSTVTNYLKQGWYVW